MKKNSFKTKVVWQSYRLIDKGKWHISWNNLLYYHSLKFTTPKPLKWFIRFVNDEDCLWIGLLGFVFIWYKNYYER